MVAPISLLTIKTAISHQNMTVGIESQEVTKGFDGNDCSGHSTFFI
jgi:hypothetical protein